MADKRPAHAAVIRHSALRQPPALALPRVDAHEETARCFEQWPLLPPSPARSLRRLSPRPSRPLAEVAGGTAAEGTGEDTAAVMPADMRADMPSMAAPTVPATSLAL